MASYNVGTRGYATGGGEEGNYRVGKRYSLRVADSYFDNLRRSIYDGPKGTGMPYAEPSKVMDGLKKIVFAPTIGSGGRN